MAQNTPKYKTSLFKGARGIHREWWVNRQQPGQAEPQQGGHHGVTFVFARHGQRHLIRQLGSSHRVLEVTKEIFSGSCRDPLRNPATLSEQEDRRGVFASTFRRHLTEQRRQHRFSFYAWPWKFYRIQNIGTESNARDRSCQDRGGENICFANAIVQPCLNIAIISGKTIKESRHCRMLLLLLMSLSLQRYYGSP